MPAARAARHACRCQPAHRSRPALRATPGRPPVIFVRNHRGAARPQMRQLVDAHGVPRRQDKIDRDPMLDQPLGGDRAVAPVVAVPDEHHDAVVGLNSRNTSSATAWPARCCSAASVLPAANAAPSSARISATETIFTRCASWPPGPEWDWGLSRSPQQRDSWVRQARKRELRTPRVPRHPMAPRVPKLRAVAAAGSSLAAVAGGGSRRARHRQSCVDLRSAPL